MLSGQDGHADSLADNVLVIYLYFTFRYWKDGIIVDATDECDG